MARVQIFQGGNIPNQGTTGARYRGADYGPSPLAEGMKSLGKLGSDVAAKIDEIEDVKARVEANRLAVEHSEAARQIGQTVTQTLGEGAEAAATSGVEQLSKATESVLGRASPRARLLLENELRARNVGTGDQWVTHGYHQKAEALESSSVARIGRIVDDAADIDDEDAAVGMLGQIRSINEERSRFFGKGKDWLLAEDQKYVSSFYKSRALKLAQGGSGSASAAISYAEQHREQLSDDDYMSVVNGYNNSALDEAATAYVYGSNPVGAAVDKPKDPEDGGPPSRLDPVTYFKRWMVSAEGSSYVIDNNGYGVKYGFNQKSNPDIDVKKLTLESASSRFRDKWWERAGADKLSPALAAVHMDTFFLNEKKAMSFLKDCGGDVDKYMQMRTDFLTGLHRANPDKYPDYSGRNKRLTDYADRLGGDGTPLAVGPNTDVETMRQTVMARTDIGLNLKRRIIQTIENRRSEVRQEDSIRQENIDNQLLSEAHQLGDKFTDVKQLSSGVWSAADEKTRERYISMAKTNKTAAENKPMTPEAAARVGFLRSFKPEVLADTAVQHQLSKMGVPTGTLRQLAMEGGQARGALAAAKPEAIARSSLEAIARPAFEAAGIRLWTTEAREKDRGKRAAEIQNDSYVQLQLLNFLDAQARTWALANPGKHPDEDLMRKWVGLALVRNRSTGQPIGTMNDRTINQSIGETNRREIERILRTGGIEPTPAKVAEYYRRMLAAHPERMIR